MVISTDIRTLQIAELRIFKELQRICEKHDVRYFLIGGSAIGSVRHHGFIPWDDDMDIGMPRPDYERFSELCRTELDPQFFWQTYRTEPAYNLIFGKLRLNYSKYVEVATAHLPIHHGIKIDVFPFDGVPRATYAKSLHRITLKFCMMKLGAEIERSRRMHLQERAASLIPRRIAIALNERMAKRWNYSDCETVVNASGAWGYYRESVPKAWVAESAMMPFEDVSAPVPKYWHEYLTKIYGDYMLFPPESERRRARHPVLTVEFDTREAPPK